MFKRTDLQRQHALQRIRKGILLDMNLDFIGMLVGFQVHDYAGDPALFAKGGGHRLYRNEVLCRKHRNRFAKAAAVYRQLSVLHGTVTHVLVDDPTKGYAIFAENMLETAQSVAEYNKLKDAS